MRAYRAVKGLESTKHWVLWSALLVALALLVAACQPAADEAPRSPTSTPAAEQEATPTPAGASYSVGFTPEGQAFKGNPDAAVVIEEYSSYQCPFCGRYFQETYPDVMRQYVETGQVLYIFKDFPLSGQPQSPKAAEAARCAGEVGGAQAYWDMHDRLFAGQREWSGQAEAVATFKGYAADLGLAQSAFDDCLDSGQMASRVQADAREGATRGVRGTPSFFINDQILVGAQPIGVFAASIEAALAGKPIGPEEATGGSGQGTPAAEVVVPTPAAFDFEDDPQVAGIFTLGDPDAPVTLVEFSDYQCPVCARHFEETWPALKQQYIDTGRVFYIFQDFPLSSIHPQAAKAHEATRCAAEVGGDEAYWDMHDQLYADQEAWSGNPEHIDVFKGYAADLDLDSDAFDTCLDNGDQADAVQADVREGYRLGVNGTPTFFVDGYPFSGAYPIQAFDQIITLAENDQLRDAIEEALRQAQAQERQALAPADVPLGDAPVKGDPAAPVTIVEYSDYQCPFCSRHFEQTWPQLLENYIETGDVRYVYKDFPLTQIHPQAPKAAEAARCARELGGEDMYWQMHDRLFAGQEEWAGNPEHVAVFSGYAADLGLDQAAFDACLEDGRYAAAVQADLDEGLGFGVSGTPAFFVNGQPLEGAQPYEAFVQLIEQALAEN